MRFPKWTLSGACVAVAALGVWASAQERGTAPIAGVTAPVREDQANHPLSPNEKGGMEESGPYEVVPDHFKPPFPQGWTWGPVVGVHAESPNRIYVYTRGMIPALDEYADRTGSPVRDVTAVFVGDRTKPGIGRREHVLTVYDGNGKLLEDWKHLDAMHQAPSSAHRIRVNPWDPEKHLWLIDTGLNRILKVTRDGGKVVMTVGPAQGRDPRTMGYQDLAFLPNGDFFVLEGSRVVKFSKDGTQLMAFGKEGTAPGEIYRGHAITIDGRGRIYVGERPRIQVFDQSGKSLDTWPNIRFGSGAISLDTKDRLWVADAEIHRIAAFDLNGKLLYHWGVSGVDPGRLFGVSQMSVDSLGNLYVAEHYGGRVQMFRPKKDAAPNHLIGPLVQ